jgi:ferric-dicitrate binding protein FerR (iron transport regulator)
MITKGLIFDYFAGNSTALQKRAIEIWLDEGTNKDKYYEWLADWEQEFPQYIPDVEIKLGEYLQMVEQTAKLKLAPQPSSSKKPGAQKFPLTAYVAGFMLLGSLFFILLQYTRIFNQVIETSFGEIKEVNLPDGSELILYSNSRLSIPRINFNRKRTVFLAGEANFKVKHLSMASKFTVQSEKGLTVVVYGTEFRFFTRERGSKLELNEGLVRLHYKEGEKNKIISLIPGESISLNKDNRLTQRMRFNPLRNSEIRKHRFVFNHTPLSELKNLLKENFGLGMVIPDKEIERLTLSGTYTGNSLNELINSLSEVTGLHIYKYQGRIYIESY